MKNIALITFILILTAFASKGRAANRSLENLPFFVQDIVKIHQGMHFNIFRRAQVTLMPEVYTLDAEGIPSCGTESIEGLYQKNLLGKNETALFAPLEALEISHLRKSIDSLFNSDPEKALKDAELSDYQLCYHSKSSSLIYSPLKRRGSAILILKAGSQAKNLVFEVPHPLYDQETTKLGLHLFSSLKAKALILSGHHRYLSEEKATFNGKLCHDKGVISDAAHAPFDSFQQMHEVLADKLSKEIFVSLHGSQQDGLTISDGLKRSTNDSEDPVILFDKSAKEILPSALVKSCNSTGALLTGTLCGTWNLQGRFLNGNRQNPCNGNDPFLNSKRFLHLELSRKIRASSNGYYPKIAKIFSIMLNEMGL